MAAGAKPAASNEAPVGGPAAFWLGGLGVLCFSFTLPATKVAVAELDPFVVALGRTVLAAPMALAFLVTTGALKPPRHARSRLGLVILGNVIGFPLCTALSLTYGSSANAAVILGLMPIFTAVSATLRGYERPRPPFWFCALGGSLAIGVFSVFRNGLEVPHAGDLFAFLAVLLGSLGYAESAVLTKEYGAMRAISWTIVCGLPVALPLCAGAALIGKQDFGAVGSTAWLGMLYVAVISSFLAFIPWNLGLVRGGISRVSQLQLVQPLLTLVWSASFLGELVSGWTVATALVVLGFVLGASRSKASHEPAKPPAERRRSWV